MFMLQETFERKMFKETQSHVTPAKMSVHKSMFDRQTIMYRQTFYHGQTDIQTIMNILQTARYSLSWMDIQTIMDV